MPRSRALVLLFSFCASGQAQNLPRSFHDNALNITYFYPAHFETVTGRPDIADKCATTTLIAESSIPAGPSSFVLSKIDDGCPELLRKANALGPFTRLQLLRQLTPFGKAVITREPTRYLIDGRSAAVTLGAVSIPAADHNPAKTVYAAKACALNDNKRAASGGRVLCFDFSTENSDLVSLMFAFIIQFDDDPPAAMFPGSVQPSYWATGGRKPN